MADTDRDKAQSVQDVFLAHATKNNTPVTVFLVNGVKLQGAISGFDSYSLLLVRDRFVQLVYKHAISTVMPAEAVRITHPDPIANQG